MAKTALRPENIAALRSPSASDEPKRVLTDEEKYLYGMSQTKGWMIFEEKARQVLAEMEGINENAMTTGLSFEEIGKNTIVISMTRGIITRLLNTVLDAKESCESTGQ